MNKLHGKKGFIRYIISYLLILLLPLSAFLVFGNQYMLSVYKGEILEQSQNSLAKLQSTVDNRIEQMVAIAGQLSSISYIKTKSALDDEPVYRNVKEVLSGHVATHDFLENIAFYSYMNPSIVYTDQGTFYLHYYKHYDGEELYEKLSDITKGTWWLPNNITWPNSISCHVGLEYAVPIPDLSSSYVIFSLSKSSLAEAAEDPDTKTFLYDKNGQLLYATQESGDLSQTAWENIGLNEPKEIDDGHYLLSASSKNTGLVYIRLISQEIIFAKLFEIQRLMAIVIIAISVIGGIGAYLMAFFNYRPIKKLDKLVAGRQDNIPQNLYGAERVSFIIKKQDERYASLERNSLKERILYKLIHSRITDRDSFETECDHAGLVFTSPFMRVALIFLDPSEPLLGGINVIHQVDQILSEPYEVCGMEYLAGQCYLLLLGYEQENTDMLRNHLMTVISFLSQYTQGPIKITVGAACNSLCEIYRSYNQSIAVSKNDSISNSVLLYEETSTSDVKFVYPKIELDTLFNAIINAETEKANLLLDILSDIIKNNCKSRFIVISLGYDVINTCLRAINDLKSGLRDRNHYADYSALCELTDANSFLEAIGELQAQIIKLICISSSKQEKSSAPQKVKEFINQNYKNPELCVSLVADNFDMSISNLSHQFKAQTGLNISECIAQKQLEFAKELMRNTEISIGDAAVRLGYNQTSSFIRKFKKYEKMTPNEYRVLFRPKIAEAIE